MSSLPVYCTLALVTVRWWWPTLRALLADVDRAGAREFPAAAPARHSVRTPPPLDGDARTPLNRVLAFRGVAQRVAARGRWQGGFGRRGL